MRDLSSEGTEEKKGTIWSGVLLFGRRGESVCTHGPAGAPCLSERPVCCSHRARSTRRRRTLAQHTHRSCACACYYLAPRLIAGMFLELSSHSKHTHTHTHFPDCTFVLFCFFKTMAQFSQIIGMLGRSISVSASAMMLFTEPRWHILCECL